ncbi:phospholipase D family protein [Pseudomonas sp. RIT-PI-S]|uniref:phospholipase D family protein n=1 Tax=Pseudomonas sp. RIT-PI-S TaxID=3035295 RepID=UPI0021D9E930|nr:phospholipase D family protein [Pseudomonas sp. RIT-PI-S]
MAVNARLLAALLLSLALGGCANPAPQPIASQRIPAEQSAFGRAIQAQASTHPGMSGFRLLPDSGEAFRARAELIRNARSSLDLQYYIVHDGLSTRALMREVLDAADRGVRVRILLDDTASDDLEDLLGTVASHPNIKVRLFNPTHLGRGTGVTRSIGRLLDLSQQHRRMHNKVWIADDSAAIVGGRNLGDEYFDAKPNLNFTDIDLLGFGPVARDLGYSFDQYWNHRLSRPLRELYDVPAARKALPAFREALEKSLRKASVKQKPLYDSLMSYRDAPRLDTWRQELIWAPSTVMWDAPAKVLASAEPDPHLLLTTQLAPELLGVHEELLLISAYFVPREPGLLYLTGRADQGVAVSLLTNSLEATDVPAVHGGYAPYRKALLEHGVKLYELRRQPGDDAGFTYHLRGSSASSLHSKAMVFDRRKVFIGSFNFDPRSVLWNTEVGVLVDSSALASYTRDLALQGMSPALSYQVELQGGALQWVTEDNHHLHVLRQEPGDWWRRFNAWVSQRIGLEKML